MLREAGSGFTQRNVISAVFSIVLEIIMKLYFVFSVVNAEQTSSVITPKFISKRGHRLYHVRCFFNLNLSTEGTASRASSALNDLL